MLCYGWEIVLGTWGYKKILLVSFILFFLIVLHACCYPFFKCMFLMLNIYCIFVFLYSALITVFYYCQSRGSLLKTYHLLAPRSRGKICVHLTQGLLYEREALCMFDLICVMKLDVPFSFSWSQTTMLGYTSQEYLFLALPCVQCFFYGNGYWDAV